MNESEAPKKERIVPDLENRLKILFQERLAHLDKRLKMIAVLRYAIFNMLYMKNEELNRFIEGELVKGVAWDSNVKIALQAKEEGFMSEKFRLCFRNIQKIRSLKRR